jgi:hypothetical protein
MTDDSSPPRHPFEPRPADLDAARRPQSDLERFLGGTPSSVLLRLVFLSLIVGFFLVWLDIRPMDVLFGLRMAFVRLWATGFDALREIGAYLAAGAVLVVPVWLALRLLTMRPKA